MGSFPLWHEKAPGALAFLTSSFIKNYSVFPYIHRRYSRQGELQPGMSRNGQQPRFQYSLILFNDFNHFLLPHCPPFLRVSGILVNKTIASNENSLSQCIQTNRVSSVVALDIFKDPSMFELLDFYKFRRFYESNRVRRFAPVPRFFAFHLCLLSS